MINVMFALINLNGESDMYKELLVKVKQGRGYTFESRKAQILAVLLDMAHRQIWNITTASICKAIGMKKSSRVTAILSSLESDGYIFSNTSKWRPNAKVVVWNASYHMTKNSPQYRGLVKFVELSIGMESDV
jgi:tRNA G26 N,N-dimethylase Trm1